VVEDKDIQMNPFDIFVAQATQTPLVARNEGEASGRGHYRKLPAGSSQRIRDMMLKRWKPDVWYSGEEITRQYHEYIDEEGASSQIAVVLSNLSSNRNNPFLLCKHNPNWKRGRGKYLYSLNPDWDRELHPAYRTRSADLSDPTTE